MDFYIHIDLAFKKHEDQLKTDEKIKKRHKKTPEKA